MKKKLIIGGALILIIALIIGINVAKSKGIGAFSSRKGIEVKVGASKIQDINATISVNGIVEEVNNEEIYFDTPVKIAKVYVKKDGTVKKGQKLVQFDLDDIYSQLDQARVSLRIQEIALNKIQDALRLQGTSQSQTAIDQAKSAMDQAKRTLDRTSKLYAEGAASLVEYESAKTQYNNASLQYQMAQSNLNDINKNNTDMTSSNSKDVENQEEQIKLTELKIQDLESKISKLNSQSISPMSGIITELNVQEGSQTNPTMKAMKIISPGELQVKLDVKEIDILKVKVDQNVEITGDAFPDKVINGTVKSIGAVALKKQGINNSDDAFVEVKVAIDDREAILKPGLSVSAKIITETRKNAVVIPFDSFQEDKDGNKWVFVVEGDSAKQKNIKVGIASGFDLEVVNGLNGNEKLVQDPPSRLKTGDKVVVQSDKK